MKGSPLRTLLLAFTKEVEANPQQYGPATIEFIQNANEAIGTRIKAPLVGWVVPRGTTLVIAAPRIAGIELTDELRKGCILTKYEALSCADGMHPEATRAIVQLRIEAANKMGKLI